MEKEIVIYLHINYEDFNDKVEEDLLILGNIN